jgi:hypothetical protein
MSLSALLRTLLPRIVESRQKRYDPCENSSTGGVGVYDIHNNQITGAAFLGTVDLNCQFAGVCNFSSLCDSDIPLAIIPCDLTTTLAARHRLSAVYPVRLYVVAGGLISYGPVRSIHISAWRATSIPSSEAMNCIARKV